ncbi:bifunctional 3'-5' exonuclease/DNA polymerase [Arthrobacter mangrovi]|uniref:DNA-directed DNA polymerase n=2 Tax=Arthrobacter mangrovi TaxID=2966350 RepID=A0ABQ5MPS3_9MICC|nr:bifunctional 3'-5' exonuclease/DNA polymerase [Arthrobacter mangrovi]
MEDKPPAAIGENGWVYMVLATGPSGDGGAAREPSFLLQRADATGAPAAPAAVVSSADLPAAVAALEEPSLRWVWEGTRRSYLPLLRAGTTVERCHDLSLTRELLVLSQYAADTGYIRALRADSGRRPAEQPHRDDEQDQFTLFDQQPPSATIGAVLQELQDQLAAVAGSPRRERLQLLVAAESAGALVAAEMERAGLPWRRDVHEEILTRLLGPRPRPGQRPARLDSLARELYRLLGVPAFNPDSPQELLRALHRADIEVRSTRSWELREHRHPAIGPLLEYKKLARLASANGWEWLESWAGEGRFRTEYVVGGVVTGRWASRGGGGLQIPQQVRDAARADEGHRLVVADASQLEPRILAALARDDALAAAARGRDLYQGIADVGFGGDRAKAKVAMLGAMYGATTGESGRLVPQLARTYPRALATVERAARAGEAGEVVSSHLGRGCPEPSPAWRRAQLSATAEEQRRADAAARSRGRFTRNFIVQSTAAEWALCWLAEVRRRLRASAASGTFIGELVFFLHDEVVLHVRQDQADAACALVAEAAADATRLMFGRIPVEFPVSIAAVDSYAEAK